MWLLGDKVHSPSDDSVLRIKQGGFLPSLVRHGQGGCISVTIDNEMIGQVILDGMHQKCIEHTVRPMLFKFQRLLIDTYQRKMAYRFPIGNLCLSTLLKSVYILQQLRMCWIYYALVTLNIRFLKKFNGTLQKGQIIN